MPPHATLLIGTANYFRFVEFWDLEYGVHAICSLYTNHAQRGGTKQVISLLDSNVHLRSSANQSCFRVDGAECPSLVSFFHVQDQGLSKGVLC